MKGRWKAVRAIENVRKYPAKGIPEIYIQLDSKRIVFYLSQQICNIYICIRYYYYISPYLLDPRFLSRAGPSFLLRRRLYLYK